MKRAKKTKQENRIPVVPAPDIEPAHVPRPKAQIVIRHERGEVCGRCGAENAFRLAGGMRLRGTVRVAAARCRKCGAIAQIKLVPCTERPFIKRGVA